MKFGDLISFSRPGYTHWAVYTGKNENGQDMSIQFTGESGLNSKAGATVKEGLLEPGGTVNNQLDRTLPARSEAEMRATIAGILREGPGRYDVIGNNCEHLATRIRYGTALSLQAEQALTNQRNFTDQIAENMGAPFH